MTRIASRPRPPDRESLASINRDGSRRFIHAAAVTGFFTRWRTAVNILLVAIYVALPWIPINGFPAVFLDLAHRQFHFFGLTFVTQDLWLAFFLISGLAFSLFYVAALFGRVWCGWGCPQTVFLDFVRRIERFCEGDAPERKAREGRPLTGRESARRALKYILYTLFAAVLAHVFLSYFVSIPRLYSMMTTSPLENWPSFLLVMFITAALYFNFAWFREQFCIILCPYGRLQGALIDKHTMVIGYDEKRGEPRGRKGTPGAGDCVACNRCVSVCPTGIDIRHGQQIECIGCAACIDACDDIMSKLGRKPGLIRYDSMEGFAGRKTKWVRPRTILYTFLLALGASAMLLGLTTIKPATVSLLRMQGAPYFIDGGEVRNQFLLRVINKRTQPEAYTIEIVEGPASLKAVGIEEPLHVEGLGEQMRPLVFNLPRQDYHEGLQLHVRIADRSGKTVAIRKIVFLGPFAP